MQTVLRCDQCHKPFDKQSTLKRHGYYCRSRKAANTIRTRSCIPCAKAKARCDNREPKCSRCSVKTIDCHYPATTPRKPGSSTQLKTTAPPRYPEVSSIETTQIASHRDDAVVGKAPATLDLDFLGSGSELHAWFDSGVDFADTLDPKNNVDTVQLPSPKPPSPPFDVTPLTQLTDWTQQAVFSHDIPIPPSITLNVSALTQRPRAHSRLQRVASLILHNLKSYPLMIMRDNALPPFIHESFLSPDIEDKNMEPLTNCISLLHMISRDSQSNRKLFWKNVRLECERLYQEYSSLNKYEALAAMQALTLYVIMRLDNGVTEYTNFDSLLLKTVTICARHLARSDLADDAPSALWDYSLETSWKGWTSNLPFQSHHTEKRQRLCTICQTVNLLVYFDPASMCDHPTDLILAPLPAAKQIWESPNSSTWKSECDKGGPDLHTLYGLAADGELVRLDEGQAYCYGIVLPPGSVDKGGAGRRNVGWEEWCKGMDGFGGLVMLAASLVG
ncbi:hypothetical protein ACLMJK_005605 [Lecanora helva]